MTTNHYINNVDYNISTEQNLVESLVIETIQFYGHTFYYIPRTLVDEDEVFGEDTLSRFDSNHALEMYIESIDGFDGQGDIIANFGLQIKDRATFVLSKRRFFEKFIGEPQRPREGDLIYFPLTRSLMEITFVEHENPFYQVGKNYVYRLTVEMFEYSHEQFDTGFHDVDQLNDTYENNNDTSNDPFADNETFETEGDPIRDFDPKDPFGDW